jgi:hypothetical protein
MNPQRAQDRAIEAAAGRELQPHSRGLSGRAADAHDQALKAKGIDEQIGAEMLAQALTDAALAEP